MLICMILPLLEDCHGTAIKAIRACVSSSALLSLTGIIIAYPATRDKQRRARGFGISRYWHASRLHAHARKAKPATFPALIKVLICFVSADMAIGYAIRMPFSPLATMTLQTSRRPLRKAGYFMARCAAM